MVDVWYRRHLCPVALSLIVNLRCQDRLEDNGMPLAPTAFTAAARDCGTNDTLPISPRRIIVLCTLYGFSVIPACARSQIPGYSPSHQAQTVCLQLTGRYVIQYQWL
jgi:hypothetical protein